MVRITTKVVNVTKLPRLTENEIKVLESGLTHVSYREAAYFINMKERTFYTIIQRVKDKIRNAKRFLHQCRRYEKMLFGEKEDYES